MFISFVQGAALSGLTIIVLEPRLCAHLGRVLLGMLKSLSEGTARQTWRGTRQKKQKMSAVRRLCCRLRTSCKCEGTMVPELGETPEGSPRGGHGSAGNVQSRRNCRSPTFDERGECMSVQYPDGKTNGQGVAAERRSGSVVRTKNERCGDFHARVLGKSEVSGIPCGRTAGFDNDVLFPRVRARANGRNRWQTGRAGRTLCL